MSQEINVIKWEDRRFQDVSRALLLISGRVSVDQLLEGLEDTKAMSLIAPFRLDDFGYTARSADTIRRNFEATGISTGVVIPTGGTRRTREDFIKGAVMEGLAPIIIHERAQYPELDRWLPYLEQAKILDQGGWYHAAGWEYDIVASGRWTRSTNIGDSV